MIFSPILNFWRISESGLSGVIFSPFTSNIMSNSFTPALSADEFGITADSPKVSLTTNAP